MAERLSMGEQPVTQIVGVGATKAKRLGELGIQSIFDILHYFPYRYEDRSIRPFESFEEGILITARAIVEGTAKVRWNQRKSTCTAWLRIDGRHRIMGVWFNQPYVKSKLTDGRVLIVSGRFNRDKMVFAVSRTEFDVSTSPVAKPWTPVYRVTKGINSEQLHSLILNTVGQFGDEVEELLPNQLVTKYKLVSHRQALVLMHQPNSEEDIRQARRRLAFEEFFMFQLSLQWFRLQRNREGTRSAPSIPKDSWETFVAALPGRLTGAQERVCDDITIRLQAQVPMSLLLQGDVGSGKTWVAFWAIYAAVQAGGQAALMAPTEILAEQHYGGARARLDPLGVKVALLTGSTPEKERAQILNDVREGLVDLVVGTHALLTQDVTFLKLRLVVTDEQHRFGVTQRSILRHKGSQPDVLFLSATPIPRTLALAVYGDLDMAVLDELPAGRTPIKTVWYPLSGEAKAIRFVRQQLAAGARAFVVAPLVEESSQLVDVASATLLFNRLREEFSGFSVSLLHGRMPSRDKDLAMRSFATGETQVLVSTTVIEVGIDVPEATVMLIYHAERFGLAQLHQLRGRVGRGTRPSTCILLSDAEGRVAKERLKTLVETNDGAIIAQRDLELRGPGEFLGVRQSGIPEFTVGDLSRDLRIMEVARDEARMLVSETDFWLLPAYERLREAINSPKDAVMKD